MTLAFNKIDLYIQNMRTDKSDVGGSTIKNQSGNYVCYLKIYLLAYAGTLIVQSFTPKLRKFDSTASDRFPRIRSFSSHSIVFLASDRIPRIRFFSSHPIIFLWDSPPSIGMSVQQFQGYTFFFHRMYKPRPSRLCLLNLMNLTISSCIL